MSQQENAIAPQWLGIEFAYRILIPIAIMQFQRMTDLVMCVRSNHAEVEKEM